MTDRGSNFIKALKKYRLMFCVAHRLNGILKRTFFQTQLTEKPTPTKSSPNTSTYITPINRTTTGRQPSPEFISFDEQLDEKEKAALEEWKNEEDDYDIDTIDYSTLDLSSIPWNAREILETIKYCKILVQYVKKVRIIVDKNFI